MRDVLFLIALIALSRSAANAQTPVPISFPRPMAQVQDFLGLTNTQVDTILKNNDDYNRSSYEKQARIRQVQSEIAEWTAASTLDPMELGIRYMEIEQLCRQMKDAAVNLQSKNVALLNDSQKAKLKVLDDAMKLMPVISEAQSASLLSTTSSPPYRFTSTLILGGITSSFTITGANVTGCYAPTITVLERSGDFSLRAP